MKNNTDELLLNDNGENKEAKIQEKSLQLMLGFKKLMPYLKDMKMYFMKGMKKS